MIVSNLLRIPSWIKNGFVLAPLIYSMQLTSTASVKLGVIAFLSYCFASSSMYILNDILDRKEDRLHPRKKNRAIASGKVSVKTAIITMILLLSASFYMALSLNTSFLIILGFFILNNLLYSNFLKHITLLDAFSIAISFVLRTIGGCIAISVLPSSWIIIITLTLSLFLVFVKRKSEIVIMGEDASEHRKALKGYSIETLNYFILVCASIAITSYIIYSVNEQVQILLSTTLLPYSSIFVLLGVFRFIQLTFSNEYEGEGDPTTLLLKDRFSQINILFYIIFVVSIIYIK